MKNLIQKRDKKIFINNFSVNKTAINSMSNKPNKNA